MSKQQVIVESKAVGFGKSQKKVKGLNSALGGLAGKAMGVAGAYFGARGIINALKSSMSLYAEQQLAEVKLEAALGKTTIGLQRYASSLQKTTRFGDELIMQGMAQLAFFIKDEEQLKIATAATLDLASAKGMDLVQAADLVAKSVGSSTNALSRYGIAAEGAVGSEERLLSITNEIGNLFGGQAVATTDSYQGAIDQLSNAFGDMQEVIGEKLAPTIKSMAQTMTGLISANDTASQSLEREHYEYNDLLNTLKRLNPESEVRAGIVEMINEKYPQYLGNLNLEKASLEDINKLQKESADIFLARIQMAMREEEIAAAESERETNARDLIQAQKDLSTATRELKEETKEGANVFLGFGGVMFTNVDQAQEKLDLATDNVSRLTEAFANADLDLQKLMSGETEAITEAKKLLAEIAAIEDEKKGGDSNGDVAADPKTEREIAASDIYKSLQDEMKDYYMETEVEKQEFAVTLQEEKMYADLAAAELTREQKLEIIQYYEDQKTKIEAKADKESIKRDKAELLRKKQQAESNINLVTGAFAEIGKAMGLNAEDQMVLDIAMATADAYGAFNTALAASPPPFNYIAAAGVLASGINAVKQIESAYKEAKAQKKSQYGFEGMITEPTELTVGEGGANEYVSVTPMEGVNNAAGGGGSTIVIQGNVMTDEFVENELAEKIQDAVRRGVDFA